MYKKLFILVLLLVTSMPLVGMQEEPFQNCGAFGLLRAHAITWENLPVQSRRRICKRAAQNSVFEKELRQCCPEWKQGTLSPEDIRFFAKGIRKIVEKRERAQTHLLPKNSVLSINDVPSVLGLRTQGSTVLNYLIENLNMAKSKGQAHFDIMWRGIPVLQQCAVMRYAKEWDMEYPLFNKRKNNDCYEQKKTS